MKILLWSAYSFPHIGGLEVMVHTLAQSLLASGNDVRVLSNNMENDECIHFEFDGVTTYVCPFFRALTAADLLMMKRSLSATQALIQEFSPELIHVHCLHEMSAFYQSRVLKNFSGAVFLTVHGLLEQKSYATPACLSLLNRTQGVSAVSESLRQDFLSFNLTNMPIKLIYNSLAPSPHPLKTVNVQSRNIVMVGRLSNEKGFEIAFEAVSKVLKNFPDIRLTIVGGGPMIKVFQHLQHQLGLEKTIEMIGFVSHDQVYYYIDNAAFVLMPSTYESFGLVALETAMRGRAIIASNIMGLREIVEDKKTGLLIEPSSVSALQEAIEFLFQHPEKIHEYGVAAYEKSKKFSLEKMTQQYIEVYRDITTAR